MNRQVAGSTGVKELTVLGACPLDCPDTCSWVVTVRDGQAVELRGNRDHPFTRGALCAKVNNYLDHTRAPDRLLHPLRRTGAKGEGRFERISWDEALDEIAARVSGVISEYGGEAVWPYYGTGTMGYVQGLAGGAFARFWNAIGASRHDPFGICSAAGAAGRSEVLGPGGDMDPELISQAKLILLWGTNTLTTGHHLWKFIQAAQRDGARLVAIDPIRTRTAERADEHLAPVPGSDTALALGLMHVVFRLGLEDREYLDRTTVGWEGFRQHVLESYPPDRVAALTGIPADRITALGECLAQTRPTAIRATMGIQRHAGGGATLRALACIPAVTGDWRRPGGGLSYSTGAHFQLNEAALFRDDLGPAKRRTLSMTRLGEGLLETTDPPVKALFVIGSNPAVSVSHQNKVKRGLRREDLFTVVMEHFHTDTVDYADIVLPATMQTEHADLHNAYGHLYLSWNEPAVEPPGECRPTTETLRRLARRMGLVEPSLYDSDEDLATQVLMTDHPALAGITLEKLKEHGWMRLNLPQPFVPFASDFATASGKFEFPPVEGAGLLGPAGEVADPARATQYPLVLIATAGHFFLNTIFGNRPDHRRRTGPPRLAMHPEDARARGLTGGEQVRIHNDRGAFEAEVEVSDRVRPGVVATTKGHWPKALGVRSGVNATVDERDTDVGGGAVYHDNRVQVDRAG